MKLSLPNRAVWLRFLGPAVILLATLVASAPQFIRKDNSCGHDFDFHLVSWLDAQATWRHGAIYPHWSHSPNYSAGEPRFIFYPPLTWMLGAALGFLMKWQYVPVALTFLMLAATGLATRALARQTLSEGPATLAGCAALFSGYALFTAFERSAFGELSGGFWIPVMLLLILRDRNPDSSVMRRAFDGSAVPLTLVVAGAWLSNAPLGVMACYMLAAVTLVVAIQLRSLAPILRASVATAIGLALTGIYLVPAAFEQCWVAIRQATDDPGLLIENSWLFGRHADPALELHDLELFKVSIIAVTMVAVSLIGLLICLRRGVVRNRRPWWIVLALIPVVVLFLQLPFSRPVWNLLPKLRFLQFPWRWLVVLEAPMAIFFASAVWFNRLRWRILALSACALFFVAASTFAAFTFYQSCDWEDSVKGMLAAETDGFAGTDEYAPLGADDSLAVSNLPDACLVPSPLTVLGIGTDGNTPSYDPDKHVCSAIFTFSPSPGHPPTEHIRLAATMPHPGYLVLLLRTYPAWRVTLNGNPPTPVRARKDGLLVVPVMQGPIRLTVDWTTTSDAIAGRWISAIALVLLAALCVLERKPSQPRLS
jgi:hypothetical protein